MAIHNQSDAKLIYIAESSWGTTPTNPDLTALEYLPGTNFAPDLVKQLSEGMRGDALYRNMYMVGKSWNGTLNMELRPSAPVFAFLEAVCKCDGFATAETSSVQVTNTASSGDNFDIVLAGTTADKDWTNHGGTVGAQVYLSTGGSGNGDGTWRITEISTTTATNDTITVIGTGSDSVSATAAATDITALYINHAEYGTTDSSFTFEQSWDSDRLAFTGGRFTSATLAVPQQGIGTVEFGLIGSTVTSGGVTLGTGSRGTTYASSTTYHNNNLALALEEGGSTFSGHVVGMSLTIENGYRLLNAASSGLGAAAIQSGRFNVTGSIDIYYENLTTYNKALDHTNTSLLLSITNGTTPMYIYLPDVYYMAPELTAPEIEADPIQTFPFTALADSNGDIVNIDFAGALS